MKIVTDEAIANLDAWLLDERGRVRVRAAEDFRKAPRWILSTWCHLRARYSLPTRELLDWLQDWIGGRTAIEVGAGMGDLGLRLGIPMSDSAVQVLEPDLRRYYSVLGTAPTDPPADVERIDANAAVQKYRPDVVIASWLTQRYQPGDEGDGAGRPKVGSSVYGPDEFAILAGCRVYIHIGHDGTHHDKRLLGRPHQCFRFPGLVSRGRDGGEIVHVWENR